MSPIENGVPLDARGNPIQYNENEEINCACDTWERMAREEIQAGREVPIVDVPDELGTAWRTGAEVTERLWQQAQRKSFVIRLPANYKRGGDT